MDFKKSILLEVKTNAASRSLSRTFKGVKKDARDVNRETRQTSKHIRENARATSRWRRELQGAESRASRLRSNFAGLRSAIVGIGLAIGGAFALRNFKDTADLLDRVAKSGKELGLNPNFVRQFQTFADFQGVDPGKTLDGLRFLNRELGKVLTNQSSASDKAIKELGIESQIKAAKDLETRLDIILTKIRERPQDQRAGLLAGFFGRSGGELNKLFAGSDEDIAATMERARKVAGEFSKTQLAQAEALSDSFTAINTAAESLKATLFTSPESRGFLDNIENTLVGLNRDLSTADTLFGSIRKSWREWRKVVSFSRRNPGELDQFVLSNPGADSDALSKYIDKRLAEISKVEAEVRKRAEELARYRNQSGNDLLAGRGLNTQTNSGLPDVAREVSTVTRMMISQMEKRNAALRQSAEDEAQGRMKAATSAYNAAQEFDRVARLLSGVKAPSFNHVLGSRPGSGNTGGEVTLSNGPQ